MRLFSFLQRNKSPAREPVGMTSPAEQVQAARARARRRLIGAVVLLGVGIVGFPLLFETQPRPLPVDVSIEIPRKEGGAPLVLPPRIAPITESASDAGREVLPPAAASAPVVHPVTVAPPAASAPALRPVPPAASAAAESRPGAAASAPRVVGGAAQPASAPVRLPPPIKVLQDPPAAERRPAAVAKEAPSAREPVKDKPLVREAVKDKEPARDVAKDKPAVREAAKDKEPQREAAKDKPAVREVAKDKPPVREAAKDKDPIRELVKDKERDKDRGDAAVEKRYIVQVGAFADAAAAGEARARAEKVGVRAFTQVIETEAGRRIRVRVGPFASREEADKALGKLRAAGLPTALLPL